MRTLTLVLLCASVAISSGASAGREVQREAAASIRAGEASFVRIDCATASYGLSVRGENFQYGLIEGIVEIRSADGESRAAASCEQGCFDSLGAGACRVLALDDAVETSGGTIVLRLGTSPVEEGHRDPARLAASTQVNCPGGASFTIGMGNDTGTCTIERDADGNVTGGSCDDGNGHASRADCLTNGGSGSCGNTSGSGTCAKVVSPR